MRFFRKPISGVRSPCTAPYSAWAPRSSRLDPGGTALSVLALGALIVPLIEGREAGWPWWCWLALCAAPLLAWCFWRYETGLVRAGGAPLVDPSSLHAPVMRRALAIALLLHALTAFFLLFSTYLQNALHVSALDAGLVFLPFGVGYLLGPLATPLGRRLLGDWVNPIGMALMAAGFVGLAALVGAIPVGVAPPEATPAALLFAIGFGQGLALPSLMRMITGRVAPTHAGMIAGVASSTLQVGTALSVALSGGIFYTVRRVHDDPAAITDAFTVAILCIAFCLGLGATLARQASVVPVVTSRISGA